MSEPATHPLELTVELPANVSREEAQVALAVSLFKMTKISLGQAVTLAHLPKRAFMDVLSQQGVPVVNYPPEELASELRA